MKKLFGFLAIVLAFLSASLINATAAYAENFVNWCIYEDGTLVINGDNSESYNEHTGILAQGDNLDIDNIYDNFYNSSNHIPWDSNRADILSVEFAKETAPISMAYWFYYCSNLISFNSENLNLSKVTSAKYMFGYCTSLEELNLDDWGFSRSIDASDMFYHCDKLKNIYCNNSWSTSSSTNMFSYCSTLRSYSSLNTYTSKKVDGTMANPDSGYFTRRADIPEPMNWCLYEDGTLVINGGNEDVYNNHIGIKANGNDSLFLVSVGTYNIPWYTYKNDIVSVEFAKETAPVSMAYWFNSFDSLLSIDSKNLDFSKVVSTKYMFYDCDGLTVFHLDGWSFLNNINADNMFYSCSNLKIIYCENTWKTSSSENMFYNCSKLRSYTSGKSYSSSNVTGTMANPDTGYFTRFGDAPETMNWCLYEDGALVINGDNQESYSSHGAIRASGSDFINTEVASDTSWIPWYSYVEEIRSVEFAKETQLISMAYWFRDCSNLKFSEIHFDNLDFSSVTSIAYMFYDCDSLESVELENLNFSNVTNTSSMFNDCDSLESVKLNNLDFSSVTDMSNMFRNCDSLISVNLDNLDFSSVSSTDSMFYDCDGLTILHIDDWTFPNSIDADDMFYSCGSLEIIYCENSWLTSSSNRMFNGCFMLRSYTSGKSYSSSNVTGTMANPDTGYFTRFIDTPGTMNWCIYEDGTLVINGDNQDDYNNHGCTSASGNSAFYKDNASSANWLPWYKYKEQIKSIEFAKDTSVLSMAYWFYDCDSLTTINFDNLDFSNVISTAYMFSNCDLLESINLNNLTFSSVTTTKSMFAGCTSLASVDLNGLDFSNVTSMAYMFDGCTSLSSVNLKNPNFMNVTDASHMFDDCDAITVLDIDDWNFPKKIDSTCMFFSCGKLKLIICENTWSASSTGNQMFDGCPLLRSYSGTWCAVGSGKYADGRYANPDTGYFTRRTDIPEPMNWCIYEDGTLVINGDNQEGYKNHGIIIASGSDSFYKDRAPKETWIPWYSDRVKIKSVEFAKKTSPVSLDYWFYDCDSLTSFNSANLDLTTVTSIDQTFDDCDGIVILRLDDWKFEKSMNASWTFSDCDRLKVIVCKNDWGSTSQLNTFSKSNNLKSFSSGASHTDSSPSSRLMCNPNTGYFTKPEDVPTPMNWCIYEDGTLVINGDNQESYNEHIGIVASGNGLFHLDCVNENDIPWYSYRSNIKSVEFAKETSPRTMAYWFYNCDSLKELSLVSDNLKLSNIVDTTSMFRSCDGLTILRIDDWNFANTINADTMFNSCSNLKIICCENTWTTSSSKNMFTGSSRLRSFSSDTRYSSSYVDATMANPDSGYFTRPKDMPEPMNWCIYEDGTLVINGDNLDGYNSHGGITNSGSDTFYLEVATSSSDIPWYSYRSNIQSVEFAKETSPASLAYWFYNHDSLRIFNSDNLDLSEVISTDSMFYSCGGLTALRLDNWDFPNSIDADKMFYYCDKLSAICCEYSWETSSSTQMFYSCSDLKSYSSGKSYSYSDITGTMANPDTGYFTKATDWSLINWCVYSDGALVINGDNASDNNGHTGIIDCGFNLDLDRKYNSSYDNEQVPWYPDRKNIQSVEFANKTNPIYMSYWFYGCNQLGTINSTNLDVSSVIDMQSLFGSCSNLSDLSGLSNWQTGSVINMKGVFANCSSLYGISGLSNWDTHSVTTMDSMFYSCRKIADLSPLSKWNVSNVKEMCNSDTIYYNIDGMFSYCSSIKSLSGLEDWVLCPQVNMKSMFAYCTSLQDISAISGWDVSKVANMSYMFQCCDSLKQIDINSWNADSSCQINCMFRGCQNLEIIWCNNDWPPNSYTAVFDECPCLHSISSGASYDSSKTSATMANSKTGYFSSKTGAFINWCLYDDGTLIINGDNQPNYSSHGTIKASGDDLCLYITTDETYVPWHDYRTEITSVEFAKSTAPVSMEYWFYGAKNLDNISTNNVDSTKLEDLNSTFYNCSSLTSLNQMKNLKSQVLKDFSSTFAGCSNLQDISAILEWDTSHVLTMANLFANCTTLVDVEALKDLNIESVEDLSGFFNGCSGLVTIDLDNWLPNADCKADDMFSNCTNLNTILCKNSWAGTVAKNENMFTNCPELKNEPYSIVWSADQVSSSMAMPVVGYFTIPITSLSYAPRIQKQVVTLEGEVVSDWNFTEKPFTFELSTTSGAPLPEGDGAITATTDENGYVTWSEVQFESPGTYTYTIKEIKGNHPYPGVQYDESEHTLTVVVEDPSSSSE